MIKCSKCGRYEEVDVFQLSIGNLCAECIYDKELSKEDEKVIEKYFDAMNEMA